jgi:hypothetical protein
VAKSWKAAIELVLTESSVPLHYAEISEQILNRGYYKTDGATPAATVNAQIAASIKHDGDRSPFVRVSKGIFALRNSSKAAVLPVVVPNDDMAVMQGPEAGADSSDSVVRAFGMYWQRDMVIWRNDTKMFGKQQAQSKKVDFGKQKGIYILYDHHTVVYVGRAIDRPLGKRLFEHTVDRLGSRWNRFSWFGLLDVTDEGDLRQAIRNTSLAALVATLEGLLIEALEPPQNRKRGDDFSGAEYIQDIDPELEEREMKNMLRSIEQKMRSSS